jgi:hypothetical protein
MKRLAHAFSIAIALLGCAACAQGAWAAAVGPCVDSAHGAYPTFCSIPHAPTDVPSAQAFHAAVVEERVAARALTRENAKGWSLQPATAADFAEEARREAAPPTPLTQTDTDTAQFAREARERATPPKKTH